MGSWHQPGTLVGFLGKGERDDPQVRAWSPGPWGTTGEPDA
jgi:hypothetical protein